MYSLNNIQVCFTCVSCLYENGKLTWNDQLALNIIQFLIQAHVLVTRLYRSKYISTAPISMNIHCQLFNLVPYLIPWSISYKWPKDLYNVPLLKNYQAHVYVCFLLVWEREVYIKRWNDRLTLNLYNITKFPMQTQGSVQLTIYIYIIRTPIPIYDHCQLFNLVPGNWKHPSHHG